MSEAPESIELRVGGSEVDEAVRRVCAEWDVPREAVQVAVFEAAGELDRSLSASPSPPAGADAEVAAGSSDAARASSLHCSRWSLQRVLTSR